MSYGGKRVSPSKWPLMNDLSDAVGFFVGFLRCIKQGTITLDSSLEKIVWTVSWDNLAYIDSRKTALSDGRDFSKGIDPAALAKLKINKSQLSTQSQAFPDFVFRVKQEDGALTCGSLLESKDSASESISSFNSTLPSGTKSFHDIEQLNKIVVRIASAKDWPLSEHPDYRTFQRRCFYLIRTCRGKPKAKISLVDGSFFETLPKDHLISQMFLNILTQHRNEKKLVIPENIYEDMKSVFTQMTDQAIIASTQRIEKASIKPRLRIMAEVEPEGNPHSKHYPEIVEKTINLILPRRLTSPDLLVEISQEVPDLKSTTIKHKRNGEYTVFQYQADHT